ncbi:MAG: MBL fold metallo-hydrolase [Ignavibacteriae bacterium]|nr:MBL fold metallo-hydrolase [Ignavibacteriota bacterium]NOG98289.1 MBL fold metallo-hydrolase [Ignavibacteriota bacterium]
MLKLKKFVFSPFLENTYVVWDSKTNETAIIDPGCVEPEEEKELSDFIESNDLNVKYLINTHCHIDHVFGNAYVKSTYDCEYWAPEKDEFLLNNMSEQAKMFGIQIKPSPNPDKFITDDTVLSLGEIQPKFLFTPGHTPGEYSIYFEEDKICITGDVLFKEGIGRTDLWGGNFDTLIESIKTQLLTLPEETVIYPGHGEDSTIGDEIKLNPFLIDV